LTACIHVCHFPLVFFLSIKSSLNSFDLVVGLANINELWLERSTSNEETINIVGLGCLSALELYSERTKLDTVLSADGTTVNDPSSVCNRLRNSLGEPASDIDVSFLSLLDRCDFASTDSPNGFIGNDDIP